MDDLKTKMDSMSQLLVKLTTNHAVTDGRVQDFQTEVAARLRELETGQGDVSQAVQNITPAIGPRLPSRKPTNTALMPQAFGGTLQEDATEFLQKLSSYAQYQGLQDHEKAHLLGCLCQRRAHDWYSQLPTATQKDWKVLELAFKDKFGAGSRDYLHIQSLLQRKQQTGESVNAYTTDMVSRMKLAGLSDPERWRTYVGGLLRPIQAKVLPRGPTSLDEAEKFALQAEQVYKLEREDQLTMMLQFQQLAPTLGNTHMATATAPATVAATPTPTTPTVAAISAPLQESLGLLVTELREMKSLLQGQQRSAHAHNPRSRDNEVSGGKFCRYCKRRGHVLEECRTRAAMALYNQTRAQNQNQSQSQSQTQANSHSEQSNC